MPTCNNHCLQQHSPGHLAFSSDWTCCWSMLSLVSAQAQGACQQSYLPAVSLQPLARQGSVRSKYRTFPRSTSQASSERKKKNLKQHQIETNTRQHTAYTGNQGEEFHQKVFPNWQHRVLSTCQELSIATPFSSLSKPHDRRHHEKTKVQKLWDNKWPREEEQGSSYHAWSNLDVSHTALLRHLFSSTHLDRS